MPSAAPVALRGPSAGVIDQDGAISSGGTDGVGATSGRRYRAVGRRPALDALAAPTPAVFDGRGSGRLSPCRAGWRRTRLRGIQMLIRRRTRPALRRDPDRPAHAGPLIAHGRGRCLRHADRYVAVPSGWRGWWAGGLDGQHNHSLSVRHEVARFEVGSQKGGRLMKSTV